MQTANQRLALITPARNEEQFIEGTIRSLIAQTVKPIKWIIVSDGSTDRTDEIVARYAAEHPWIGLERTPPRQERHFAGKIHAFNTGLAALREITYDFIGNLDADISLDDPTYLAFLLGKFAEQPQLGVAGTPFRETGRQYDYRFTSVEHVSGACQLFRRECFAAIGGYQAIRVGGVDLVAVVTARMKGWQTRSFPEKFSTHHRRMGTGTHKPLMVAYRGGYHDYLMGVHPAWQTFRCIYQMSRRPLIVGGALLLAGYYAAMLARAKRPVSPEFVAFRRKEQMNRLSQFFRGLLARPFINRRMATA